MQILKSLLWSLTFPVTALIGQVIGHWIGDVLYRFYNDSWHLNLSVLNETAPVIISGLVGGFVAAELINRHSHPIHLGTLMVIPSMIIALTSWATMLAYIESGDLEKGAMLVSNLAMITIFYRMVRAKHESTELEISP